MIMGVLIWTAVLAVGIAALVKGANWLVEGGGRTAAHIGVPAIIIGLTLFSFGSTLPELASSLAAVGKGRAAIPVGNVIGSNIANIMLVLGASALVRPIKIKKNIFRRELPILFASMLLLILFSQGGAIFWWEGSILLLFLVIYLTFLIWKSMNSSGSNVVRVKQSKAELKMDIVKIIVGIGGVILGAEMAIRSAEFYIVQFGISEGVVGLSIIALGTSLPELATATTASRKDKGDISLGNVIGANIFNILLVLGICALITPLTFSYTLYTSMMIMIIISVVLSLFSFSGRVLSRFEGTVMVVGYLIYLVYLYLP